MRVYTWAILSTKARGKLDHSRLRVLTVLTFDRCNIMNAISASQSKVGATPGSSPPHYYIPFSRNKQFVGRRDVLATLKRKLFDNKDCHSVSLLGLGGVGKTQIALEFAYSVEDTYKDYSIFWFPALSMESFEQACKEVAIKVGISHMIGETEDVKEVVMRYLSEEAAGRWLLIVDNADDADTVFPKQGRGIHDYLPHSKHGLLLFTTRYGEMADGLTEHHFIDVEGMSHEDATELFRNSVQPKHKLNDNSSLRELLNELAYLPLAISQATSFINVKRVTIKKYLEKMRAINEEQVIKLLDDTSSKKSQKSVATTWLISFGQMSKESPNSAKLLAFMGCVEWKAIPQSILPTEPEEDIDTTIGILKSYAFVSSREVQGSEEERYDLHRLVHLAARNWLRGRVIDDALSQKETLFSKTMKEAIKHISKIFPIDEWQNRERWREYLPHASKVLSEEDVKELTEKYDLCLKVGRCLIKDGRGKDAIPVLEICLKGRQDVTQHSLLLPRSNFKENNVGMPSTSSTTRGGWSPPPISSFQWGQQDRQSEKLSPVVAAVQKDKSQDETLVLEARYALALACFSGGQAVRTVNILEEMIKTRQKRSKKEDKSLESLEWQLHLGRAYLACNRQHDGKRVFEYVGKLSPDGHPLKALAIHEFRNIEKRRKWMDTISIDSMINAMSNSSNANTLSFKDRIIGVVGARALAHALKQGTVTYPLTKLDLSGAYE
ncbi:hypothetical protein HDU93_006776 [Gonapodya sp. JEL0774]|nr:hypothetical protein HDU93_006776 [Gonapodya sp. JEL0774]